jgi:PBP1b-binding outer membrane lipoprotein LpoB
VLVADIVNVVKPYLFKNKTNLYYMKTYFYYILTILFLSSCANIIMPDGGEKDTSAPDLTKIDPPSKAINFKEKKITFYFDENIAVNNWNDFFFISPLLKGSTKHKIKNKELTIFLDDTLKDNTTYSLILNNCIKDVNEGNILKNLEYLFSTSDQIDTLNIKGKLIDAKTLGPKKNTWVFLHKESLIDSLSFKSKPAYLAKSNDKGFFSFGNIDDLKYNIFSISGLDFTYEEGDEIGFKNELINSGKDSNLIIYMSDPLYKKDITKTTDTLEQVDSKLTGSLHIKSNLDSNIIIQLYKGDKMYKKDFFSKSPYIIDNIPAGEYALYLTIDNNNNNSWDTGNFTLKKQPEKVYFYKKPIHIRANWDLEVNWTISE